MKTNNKTNSSAKGAKKANQVSSNSSSNSTAKASAKKEKAQPIVVNEKMMQYAHNRAQRINERYLVACNYSATKASTANIVNAIATANTFNAVTVETLCNSYIAFVKTLKNELPKELIGLLKKYGCDTIRAQVTANSLQCFIDNRANVNTQSLVRLVCKFNKDIADIVRNVRKEQKQQQSKGANK